jgi:D-alanine transfer protein
VGYPGERRFRSSENFENVRRPSLLAAGAALAIAAVVILMAYAGAKHSLSSNLDQVALANLEMSRLGLDSQKTVLSRDDYLPVYGSCELNLRVFDRIDSFFASKPTGFRVEPLAKAGNTDLLIAETCAALGPAIRNKKLAVIISPEWFYRPQVLDVQYAANFSVEHALAALTSPTLGGAIKKALGKTDGGLSADVGQKPDPQTTPLGDRGRRPHGNERASHGDVVRRWLSVGSQS